MTDKQIIIDGVDVSGCGYYDPNADKESHFLHDCKKEHAPCWSCVSMPSCLYKKYKRKEQECEELKKGYSELTEIVSPYMDDFTGYNEELGGFDIVLCVKELMEQLESYKMEAEEGKEINAELKAENKELKKANIHIDNNRMVKADKLKRIEDLIIACNSGYTDEFIQNLLVILHESEPCFESKLKQTLTEIKEIAEEAGNAQYLTFPDFDLKQNAKMLMGQFNGYLQQILQKISDLEV